MEKSIEQFFNIEAEQIILGSIIMHNVWFDKVADLLKKEYFYLTANQEIWERLKNEIQDGVVDQVILQDFFIKNEAIKELGGLKYLTTLLTSATGSFDLRSYAKEIIELWQKRQFIQLAEKSIDNLKSKKFSVISADFENELIGLTIQEAKKKTQTTDEILNEMDNEIISNEFVATGFEKLDNFLNGGIYKQQLCFIGARPSVGKTSIGQNIILNASLAGKKCLFISLEVDKRNVIYKFLSILSGVQSWRIQKQILNEYDRQDYLKAKEKLKQLPISISDSSYLSINQIGRIIKNKLDREMIDLIVVDYIQIIRGDDVKGKNEALIIKENSTLLKSFARQFNVAILALAQINRKAVEGANQEPTINDFKSSGGIEEDADVAIILHRDRNEDKTDSYFSNSGKMIIAKNRHGRTGEITVKFNSEIGKFEETDCNF